MDHRDFRIDVDEGIVHEPVIAVLMWPFAQQDRERDLNKMSLQEWEAWVDELLAGMDAHEDDDIPF